MKVFYFFLFSHEAISWRREVYKKCILFRKKKAITISSDRIIVKCKFSEFSRVNLLHTEGGKCIRKRKNQNKIFLMWKLVDAAPSPPYRNKIEEKMKEKIKLN